MPPSLSSPALGILNERLLNDAGGWQTMKQARALWEMNRVGEAAWEPPLLQGRVREGETEFRAGLKILSRTNVENLCSCRASRQHGAICAHSMAVGLEVLRPHGTAVPEVRPVPGKTEEKQAAGPIFSQTEGTALECSVLLPPDFAGAWQKGELTVVIEGALNGKRVLLTGLKKETYRVSGEDARLIEGGRALAGGDLPGVLSLSPELLVQLLGVLTGHPRVHFGREVAAEVLAEALRPELALERTEEGGLKVRVNWKKAGRVLRAGNEKAWLLAGHTFQPVAPGLPAAHGVLLEGEVIVPAEGVSAFVERELPALRSPFQFELPAGFELEPEPWERVAVAAPAEPKFHLELEGSLNHLAARLQADNAEQALTAGREKLDRLRRAGFAGPDVQGQMILKGEQRVLAFFARELPWWEREAHVTLGARFEHVTAGIERVRPRLEVRSSGESWFDLHVELGTSDGERFSAAEIQRLLQSGQSYVRTRTGKTVVFDPAMLDDLQQTLRDCEGTQKQPGLYRVDRRQSAFVQAMAVEQGMALKAPKKWRDALSGLQTPGELSPVDLGSLEEVLRPYQKHGVSWLSYLARSGLAGILADEMGLGKTLQALAFLRALGGKALIVCPTTLVYNWAREAARFTPERKVLMVEGGSRQALFGAPMAAADLVITSYALLRRDAELYAPVEFQVAVLDEAQHIKNPDTQNAQAAFSIQSRHRFVLTGTPVENSVRDIWSLMNFLMPGYLGSREDFRDRYEKGIAAAPDGPEQKRLTKRLRPFILRRKKKDVLTELPDKIEQVAYCELTEPQKVVYAELLTSTRRRLSEFSGEKEQNKARMVMLTALLRLRQACCDLRLLKMEGAKPKEKDSGKLELFGELLQEMLDDGHRVLVFSQFVEMLKLLEEWLKREGVDYCYLDGSTKDRSGAVDRFQTGEVPVFLISLKAGGVGLNLTAADTVVHFDPWWNPAVEAQATDRAHRIGQKKVVTAYKLITRGTIEEKILTLQQKKKQVIDATVESEEPMMQALSLGELAELLE